MSEKPIIRHCKNCEWYKYKLLVEQCEVKYQYINNGRIKALFCRFYKQKDFKIQDGMCERVEQLKD